MTNNGLRMLFWGFLFIMISIRIEGFDIFPATAGYILFALGFRELLSFSPHFKTAFKLNFPLILFSLISVYKPPVQDESIQTNPLGTLGVVISILTWIINLLVMYNLFMGINEIKEQQNNPYMAEESRKKWIFYLCYQLATLLIYVIFFIPQLAMLYMVTMFIVSIVLVISIMIFINKCRENTF